MKKLLPLLLICSLSSCASSFASNQFSVGLRGGLVNSSTAITGDSLYWQDYAYDEDHSMDKAAIGPYLRYLYMFKNKLSVGVDGSIQQLGTEDTFYWANEANGTKTDDFQIKINRLIELDALAGLRLSNGVSFFVFGGPAWVKTKYRTKDLLTTPAVEAETTSKYQPVANVGFEVDWQFKQHWDAAFRGDYVFSTSKRTVADTTDYSLSEPITATSRLMLFEFSIAYTF